MIFHHFIVVAIAATFATAKVLPPTNRALQDVITASLLQLKTDLLTGNRSKHIPPMDPLPLPHILVNHTSGKNMTAVSMNLTNIWADGLSTFDPRRVVVVDDRIGMWLAFPGFLLNGTYALYGSLLGMPFHSHGAADLAVMDVETFWSADLKREGNGNVTLSKAKLESIQTGEEIFILQRLTAVKDNVVDGVVRSLAKKVSRRAFPMLEAVLGDALTKSLNASLTTMMVNSSISSSGSSSGAAAGFSLPSVAVYEAGNANEFLDAMIKQARPSIAERDPLTLPDETQGFQKKILGIRVHGEAKIYDGFLFGIQTIHRTGDAEMTQSADMTKLKIKAKLGMSKLNGHYRMHAKFMNLGPSGEVSVQVSLVSVEIHVSVDLSTGKPKTTLEYFDIDYVGNIGINFDGLGPLDWIINPLGGWIINLVKDKIVDAVEGPLRKIIADKIQNVEIPIGY